LRPASPSLFDVRHALRDDFGYLQYRLAKLRMPRHLELKVITINGQFLTHSSKALNKMIDLLNGSNNRVQKVLKCDYLEAGFALLVNKSPAGDLFRS
jgi:hypothetical protein